MFINNLEILEPRRQETSTTFVHSLYQTSWCFYVWWKFGMVIWSPKPIQRLKIGIILYKGSKHTVTTPRVHPEGS